MEIDFEISTLRTIKEFQSGLKSLITKYPNFDFKSAIRFLETGEKSNTIPEEAYDEILRLNELRKNAIQTEMSVAKARAKLNGEEIDPKYLDGSDFTYCFESEVYDKYSKFAIYNFLQFGPPISREEERNQKNVNNDNDEPSI